MDVLQTVAVVTFVAVYALLATRWVHRAVVALGGALVLALSWGTQPVLNAFAVDILLVTGGLMVLAGAIRRSGLASWLALRAAQLSRGRPGPLLVLTSLVTFALGALVGPQAVLLVVPVVLLLAVELDVDALPFLVVLTWAGVLGSATLMTAQPSNLWMAQALGLDAGQWVVTVAPFTLIGLATTLLAAWPLFRGRLRVTHERRARILEYDTKKTVVDGPLLAKTVTVLGLLVVGFVASGWGLGLSPAVVALGAATLLLGWEGREGFSRGMADLEPGVLVFYGGLFVVADLGAAPLAAMVSGVPSGPVVLSTSTALAALVDHGAVLGALLAFLRAWETAPDLWLWALLGTTIGSAITVLGSTTAASALGFAAQGRGAPRWKDYTLASLAFAVANLTVMTSLLLLRG